MTPRPPRLATAAALLLCALLAAPRARAGESAPPGDAEEQKYRARREVQGEQENAAERQRVNEQRPSGEGDEARQLNQQRQVGEAREAAAQRETAAPPQPPQPPPRSPAPAPAASPTRHPQRHPARPQPVQKRPKLHTPVAQAARQPARDRRAAEVARG